MLTQLRDIIWAERLDINQRLSVHELQTLDALTRRYPTGVSIYRMAKAYALNNQLEQAEYWLLRACKFAGPEECGYFEKNWEQEGLQFGAMKKIPWPPANGHGRKFD